MVKTLSNSAISLLIVAACAFSTFHVVTFAKNFTFDTTDQKALAAEVQAQQQQRVVMYATDWCGYCAKARSYFETHNINYAELNIETSADAMAQFRTFESKGTPLILIDDHIVRGFNRSQLDAIIDAG